MTDAPGAPDPTESLTPPTVIGARGSGRSPSSLAPPESPPPPAGAALPGSGPGAPPEELDEYHLLRPLGKGAMGQVYLAQDTLLDRLVAIKWITALAADADARSRFLIEARAIARLQHPNVVSIYRVGQFDGRRYLVSEYVSGRSLDQVVRPLSGPDLVRVALGLARGLHAAHRRGVLHRDIKPANAMLADDGEVKLLDFGLAKLVGGSQAGRLPAPGGAPQGPESGAPGVDLSEAGASEASTMAGQAVYQGSVPHGTLVVGTPRYMAPEIWLGQQAQPRSDLYSLGALLYELASGATPHPERDIYLLRQAVLTTDAPTVRSVAPQLDARLGALIDRCLSRPPEDRFASAEELLQALLPLQTPDAAELAAEAPAPYRGLGAFEAEHRALFLGRTAEVREVLDLLLRQQLVVVAGDSGVGKSSLCRAGVLPRCAAALPGGLTWTTVSMLPGQRPMQALLQALSGINTAAETAAGSRSAPGAAANIREARGAAVNVRPRSASDDGVDVPPADGEAALAEAVALAASVDPQVTQAVVTLLSKLGDHGGVVLLCDQAEELFTQADPHEARSFGLALAALLRWPERWARRFPGQRLGVRVLLTVRGDFLTRLAALPGIDAEISGGLYVLRPLSGEGLREVIIGPARQRGVAFENEDLVQELVQSTLRQEGGLPLLEFTLLELWALRDQARQVIPALGLRALGGVAGALARHADGVIDALSPESRVLARWLLLRLLSPQGLRLRRVAAELLPAQAGAGRRVLEHLVRGRLVVARAAAGPSGEGGTYEIAHEALCAGWARLREWLLAERERLVVLERLELQAREWRRLGQASEALWGARQLAEVAALQDNERELPPAERDFLGASRRQVRRRRIYGWGVLPAVALGLIAAWGGVRWREQRQTARLVQLRTTSAQEVLRKARAEAAALATEQLAAAAAFNGGQEEAGEAAWARVRLLDSEVRFTYAQASKAVEGALSLDHRHPALRRLFAEVLYERALLAEAERSQIHKEDLLGRLATFDDGGELRRRWAAPAVVELSVAAAGAPSPGGERTHALAARIVDDGHGLRQQQAGSMLGQLPLRAELAPGAYVLTLVPPAGSPAVTYPVLLRRGETLKVQVPLPARLPPGMVYVPPGRFLYGTAADESTRRGFLRAEPLHEAQTGGYLIAVHETTYADWIAYLRALPAAERVERLPSSGLMATHGRMALREREEDGRYELLMQPGTQQYRAREGEPLRYAGSPQGRDRRTVQDWLRFPVTGISCADAKAYVQWLHQSGRVPGARLCTEKEWERAARGADDREFSHGDVLQQDDANFDRTYGRRPLAFGPDEVGSHPASRSPFGVDDLTGNAVEWVEMEGRLGWCVLRGGGYYYGEATGMVTNHSETEQSLRDPVVGLRVCASYP